MESWADAINKSGDQTLTKLLKGEFGCPSYTGTNGTGGEILTLAWISWLWHQCVGVKCVIKTSALVILQKLLWMSVCSCVVKSFSVTLREPETQQERRFGNCWMISFFASPEDVIGSVTYESKVEGQRENKNAGYVVCPEQLVISSTAMTRYPITRQHKQTVGNLETIVHSSQLWSVKMHVFIRNVCFCLLKSRTIEQCFINRHKCTCCYFPS